jgi:glycosyltransferase involved in cell wall biosynthesis
MSAPQPPSAFNVALQFGHVHHWNEGLAEVSRQLGLQFASRASQLKAERNGHLHFILPKQWHGMFGTDVTYHDLQESMRWHHHFAVDLDVWHGLHQHMRYRPPVNSKRNIITVHDLNHVYAKHGLSLWWQNLRMTRQLRRAHQLVAITDYVANDIRRHLPWAPPATVVYNGVADLSQSVRTQPSGFMLKDYLLHISRMSPSKNVGVLIEMAALWPDQALLLVGPDSPEVSKHKAHVAQLGLKNVHFLTDVSEAEKAWLLAHCKAFLFPSLIEGFGLPPIEAMYFGKTVFVSRLGSLPEVCGDRAYYWNDLSPAAMKRDVQGVLQADDFQPNRPAPSMPYNWRTAGDQYLALYLSRHD